MNHTIRRTNLGHVTFAGLSAYDNDHAIRIFPQTPSVIVIPFPVISDVIDVHSGLILYHLKKSANSTCGMEPITPPRLKNSRLQAGSNLDLAVDH